jgi:hypothetical protein
VSPESQPSRWRLPVGDLTTLVLLGALVVGREPDVRPADRPQELTQASTADVSPAGGAVGLRCRKEKGSRR